VLSALGIISHYLAKYDEHFAMPKMDKNAFLKVYLLKVGMAKPNPRIGTLK
jgi:hypothetical protein